MGHQIVQIPSDDDQLQEDRIVLVEMMVGRVITGLEDEKEEKGEDRG